MANRRLFDSSHHATAATSNTCHAHFKSKTLLLSLALISCLIPINCASFGHHSVNQREQSPWQKQPEYRLYSNAKDDVLADELLLDELKQRQSSLDESQSYEQQLNPSYYLDSFSSSSRSQPQIPVASQSETEQLYEQLALARQLVDNEQQAAPIDFQNEAQNLESFVINEQPDYNSKLVAELLQYDNDKKFSRPSSKSQHKAKLTDSVEPLYLPIDQALPDSSEAISINYSKKDETMDAKDLGKVLTEQTVSTGEKAAKTDIKDIQRNFTTLLESEEEETSSPVGKDEEKKKDDDAIISTKAPLSKADSTYGTVVTSANEQEAKPSRSKSGSTSLFDQMYKKLASYLPFLSKQTNGSNTFETTNVKLDQSSGSIVEAKGETKEVPEEKRTSTTLAKGIVNQLNAKQSVSGQLDPIIDDENVSEHDNEANDNDKQEKEDRKVSDVRGKIGNSDSTGDLESSASSSSSTNGLYLDSELDKPEINLDDKQESELKTKEGQRNFKLSKSSINVESPALDDEVDLNDGNKKQYSVNHLRQSSLAMPFKSSDELVLQSSSSANQEPSSLLGKYIYKPDYRLNSNNQGKQKALDVDDEQMYTQMSHRSYSRRLHPTEDIYNSYGALGPLYGAQNSGDSLSSLVVNKTNDVYFLVMVASFCAMAMAVVLAAGLFAYRVQQNRKSTTENDYPTYGVVGPNGKCGAASFVGGYFAGIGPNSRESGSKSGSIKHLPDIYGGSDSGLATSKTASKRASNDQASNGNNRSDFMANQNAARMYHYQHQKQQMIISDRASTGRHTSASDLDSEEENDDGSYTVYECPGLASAHEMEIKNPMFNEDQTP